MKLLIHHHAPVFQTAEGFYVQSFIGYWIKALSEHFEEVGVLLQTSPQRSEVQDTLVEEKNITLHILPSGGRFWDYFQRKKKIAAICQQVSPHYDVLIVRGLTPRQWTVWRNCVVMQKAYLLVGSIRENKPQFSWSRSGMLTFLLSHIRLWEYGQITKQGIMLANSPHLVQEIADLYQKKAYFISTNTIQASQVPPFVVKEINATCTLLFCGRVVPDKGIAELVEALGLLQQQHTNVQFSLQIIGKVSAAYKVYLVQIADKYHVTDRIEWVGFVPFGTDLLAYYRQADIMVLPSYHEGFPHCIWEAGASSTPVVVTKVGGIPGLMDETMVTYIAVKSSGDISAKVGMLLSNHETSVNRARILHAFTRQYTVEAGAQAIADIFQVT